MRLIVASNNGKKRAEISAILAALGIEVVPAEETRHVEVVEDGDSFAANARKKAEAFAGANGLPALADDSGLMVDALRGAPGIHSARYAGASASDADNNGKLLHALDGIGERSARFVCALHLDFADGSAPIALSGAVEGEILHRSDGSSGFGYDPLFFCPELGKSFGRASIEEKASVSHRGRALRQLAAVLKERLGANEA